MLVEAVLVAKKPKGQCAGGGDAGEGGAGEGALQKARARRSSAYGNGGHAVVVLVEAVAMAIRLGRPQVSFGRFRARRLLLNGPGGLVLDGD